LDVLTRLTKAAVVLALACSIGLHWAFFQSLAWAGMVINYAQGVTFTEAIEKTFDGKHPCALCKQIARTKQCEKKSDTKPNRKGFEFSYASANFIFGAPDHYWKIRAPEKLATTFAPPPPVPPPRGEIS
jgi:hypothetical protein